MLKPFRADIGPYSILLPGGSTLDVEVIRSPPDAFELALTKWTARLRRYQLFVHLDAGRELAGLKEFIDFQTRGDAEIKELIINGIPGVCHGNYGPARTWIDWWFKKGDTMICLNLQSVAFPVAEPSDDERDEHREIIGSLKFIPDDPDERPPNPAQSGLR